MTRARLTRWSSPLWVPALALCLGVTAAVIAARALWRETWS